MKQNKKAKICFVIYIAGKRKLFFYIYAVIVKQKIYKRPTNHYSERERERASEREIERERASERER